MKLKTTTEQTLTNNQYAQFMRDGFIKLSGFATTSLIERMRLVVETSMVPPLGPVEYEVDVHYPGSPIKRTSPGGDTPRRLLNAYTRDRVFREWASDTHIIQIVKCMLGTDAVCLTQNHHNCIMTKLPRFSSQTEWHQDIRYWSFDRPELVNVWLSLGNETQENGGMKMIPGSHRMEFERGRLDVDLFLRQDLPENQALLNTAVSVDMNPGDVLIFHCRTFHSAGANTTSQPKYSLVYSYHSLDNRPIAETRSSFLESIRVG